MVGSKSVSAEICCFLHVILQFTFYSQRYRKTRAAVKGGRSPFILTLDGLAIQNPCGVSAMNMAPFLVRRAGAWGRSPRSDNDSKSRRLFVPLRALAPTIVEESLILLFSRLPPCGGKE